MNRCYFSVYCRGFYILLILGNLVCIAWTLYQFGKFPRDMWFTALEIALLAMVISEVTYRMYLQGCTKFWGSGSNLLDVFISLFCIVALGLALFDSTLSPDVEGLSGEVLLTFRCFVQFLRLILLIKNQKKAQVTGLQMIDFSELAEPDRAGRAPEPDTGEKRAATEEGEEKQSAMPNSSIAELNSGRGVLFNGRLEDLTDEERGKEKRRIIMIPNRV